MSGKTVLKEEVNDIELVRDAYAKFHKTCASLGWTKHEALWWLIDKSQYDLDKLTEADD